MLEYARWTGRNWVGPLDLENTREVPRSPGLYALVAFRNSTVLPIPRFLNADASGLLYVGKATRLRGRIATLARSYLKEVRGHLAGRNFERIDLLRAKVGLGSLRDEIAPKLFYLEHESVAAAEAAETRLLHDYIAVFGEAPPMNGQASWLKVS